MNPITINFEGLLRSPASWAKVNRELLKALNERDDVKLAVKPRRGFNWDRDFPIAKQLEQTPQAHNSPDVRLTSTFPPLLERESKKSRGGQSLLLSVYEASRLPPDWVDPLRTFQGKIIVPSKHVKAIYQRDSIPRNKLVRVPFGYNPKYFFPGGPSDDPSDPIRVITVSTPHYRKGLDLLKGLGDLASRQSLHWKIHASYRPELPANFWEDPRILEQLNSRGFIISTSPLGEPELARLIRSADLCVQPSRSEGFGLSILEAMACGTPVVTGSWGGHLDFKGPGMLRVDGALRPAGRSQYHRRREGAAVFEPDGSQLRLVVRRIVNQSDRRKKLGSQAYKTVKKYTWERSAQRVVQAIRNSN